MQRHDVTHCSHVSRHERDGYSRVIMLGSYRERSYSTMKLAKAAAQQLKGVIIEYDVLCSTLLGKSAAEQARRRLAAEKTRQQKEQHVDSSLFGATSVESMLVSDVRMLLKDLNEDSTGKPWVVKERLQSTLQGLPNQSMVC